MPYWAAIKKKKEEETTAVKYNVRICYAERRIL